MYNVLATQWVGVSLPSKVPKLSIGSKDVDRLKSLQRVSYTPGGYYCDEVDLRLPFPFLEKPSTTKAAGSATPQNLQSPSLSPLSGPSSAPIKQEK